MFCIEKWPSVLQFEVSRQAQMARVIPPHVRGKAVALYGGVVRVGAVGGPILGGLISQAAGQGAVFAVEAVALALAALSTVFVGSKAAQQADDSKQNPKKKKKNVDIRPAPTMLQTLQEHSSRFLTAGVAASLLTLVRMSRAVAVPMIGAEIGLSTLQIGACMSVSSAIEAPLFIPVGWAYDRFGRKPVIIPGIAVVSAAWVSKSDEFCIKTEEKFVLKTRNFVFKMMNRAGGAVDGLDAAWDVLSRRTAGYWQRHPVGREHADLPGLCTR